MEKLFNFVSNHPLMSFGITMLLNFVFLAIGVLIVVGIVAFVF